jgi:hypothetical protein
MPVPCIACNTGMDGRLVKDRTETGRLEDGSSATEGRPAKGCPSVELSICSDPGNLAVVRRAVEKIAREEGFVPGEVDSIVLATDEALANVMKHGYEGRKDCTIRVRLERVAAEDGRNGLKVTVRDYGKQVDWASTSSVP